MTIKIDAFLALEASLSDRLSKSYTKTTKPLFQVIESLMAAGQFIRAREVVQHLSLDDVFLGHERYIEYLSHLSMLFGASRVSRKPGTTLVGLGFEKDIVFQAIQTFKQSLTVRGRVFLIQSALQSIALQELRHLESISKAEKPRSILQPFATFMNDAGKSQFNIASSLHTSRLSAYGFTAEADVMGYTTYQITEQLDPRTCEVCRIMHGKTFKVSDARNLLSVALRTKDPAELKSIQPWPSQSKAGIAELMDMSPRELVSHGWHVPPFHPRPMAEDTEFLSKTGWKLVKDANVGELAFSLNPETGMVEWVSIGAVIHAGKAPNSRMVHFKSQNADLMVTEDHDQTYLQMLNKGSQLSSKPAGELLNYSKVTIPRGGDWIGEECSLTPERVQLLALWISDGSVDVRSQNSYYITIATRKYGELAKALVEVVTGKPAYVRDNRVECNDTDLGKYLHDVVGTGFMGKRIPDAIMNADIETITLFLNTYLIGDGSVCGTKGKYGKSTNKTFYTSNPLLAAQLGELIVKAGGFPSYREQDNSLAPQFIGGREIVSKHLVHRVRWCISSGSTFGKNGKGTMAFVPYYGDTYCLTLERNHVFYVRRNGKCIWTGNCRGLLARSGHVPPLGSSESPQELPKPLYAPSLDEFKALGLNISEDNLSQWATKVPMSPAELFSRLKGVGLPEYLSEIPLDESLTKTKAAAGIKSLIFNEDHIALRMFTEMFGSKQKASLVVKLMPEEQALNLSILDLEGVDQASGIAKKAMKNLVGISNDLGYEKITLTAGLDIGGYAWAKFGFSPTAEDWLTLRGRILSSPATGKVLEKATGLQVQAFKAIMASDDPLNIFALADIPTIGKKILAGTTWQGALDFSSNEQMTRFLSYIGKGA